MFPSPSSLTNRFSLSFLRKVVYAFKMLLNRTACSACLISLTLPQSVTTLTLLCEQYTFQGSSYVRHFSILLLYPSSWLKCQPWKWSQYVPPKRWCQPASPHGLTTKNTDNTTLFLFGAHINATSVTNGYVWSSFERKITTTTSTNVYFIWSKNDTQNIHTHFQKLLNEGYMSRMFCMCSHGVPLIAIRVNQN
jgi:hypothetical protein